jgi:hypothetical protein
MKLRKAHVGAAALAITLSACTTIPTGPSLYALPGTGKHFDQFRADDLDCRQYAQVQTGTTANNAAVDSGLKSAAVGTAVGAVAGAAMGGSNAAAVGAGAGMLVGSLAGTGAAQASGHGVQRRYDAAYGQCMYGKGHKIPVSASFAAANAAQPVSAAQPARTAPVYAPPPPRYSAPPPPPPGAPPPPPPGVR